MRNFALFLILAGSTVSFAAPIDPARAMADVEKQCAFGPRIPGTPEHGACREWIKAQILDAGLTIWQQPFDTDLPLIGTRVQAFNLWGLPAAPDELGKSKEPLFIISAHWDTRPKADGEPPGAAQTPFVGANDGGSGVAVALAIARAIKGTPLAKRVVFAFWDAEDSGVERNEKSWCLGSQYAAAHRPPWFDRVRLGVNLDMIGGKGMKLSREGHSERIAPGEVKRLWRIGIDLAPDIFLNSTFGAITDDHLSFIRENIPFIDLIGLPYPHWHRITDTPDKCDGRVMSKVGLVLIEFLGREARTAR